MQTIERIPMPVKMSEQFRMMEIGDSIEMPDTYKSITRGGFLSGAQRAFPAAVFVTRKMPDGTIRLFRTA